MTPQQFWDMSPALFALKVEGYYRQQNRAAYYYRETYAMLYNLHRGEKNPAITGEDVLTLLGEKPKRKGAERSGSMKLSDDDFWRLTARANNWPWPPTHDSWKEEYSARLNGLPWPPLKEGTIEGDSTTTNS